MTTETNNDIIEQAAQTEAPAVKPKMTESLTRTFDFTVSTAQVEAATDKRLKQMAKTVKVAGFRPGHVPMARVKQMYGQQANWEALNDQVGEEFAKQAIEQKFQIVGAPDIVPTESPDPTTQLAFKATFEVYPEVPEVKLADVQIEQAQCTVTEADITRTIDVLRQQRVQYVAADKAAANDDQVTVDFLGKLDDVAFDGGTAKDYVLVLGQGRMLPEFETAIVGLKASESRTFDLPFPEQYHSKDLAGKTAQFTVTVNAVAAPKLPELNSEFAKSLGVKDGDVAKMQADIKLNLEREIANRAKGITKNNVMDALVKSAEFDVPTSMVDEDIVHLQAGARDDLRARGIPVNDKMVLPADIFTDRATRRVRLGLLIADIVKKNELQATPEQVKAHIESIAAAYEDPQGFIKWYSTDKERKAQIEAITMEDNVVAWALKGAKVTSKDVAFEELMNPQQ
jgi:trigger factor